MTIVQTGLPGSQRCCVHSGAAYLAVEPHALAPRYEDAEMSDLSGHTVHVEYVAAGRLLGQCWMFPEQAMRLQLHLVRQPESAERWLQDNLQGRAVFATNVREIHTVHYPSGA